jgi:type II secretory pathway component PulJ
MKRAFAILTIITLFIIAAPFAPAATFKAIAFSGAVQQESPRFTEQLADQITGFFEWALRAHFNRAERAKFQQQLATVWASNDQKAINNFVSTLAMREQLNGRAPAEQAAIREKFEAALVEELRKSKTDEMSQLLLAVYEEARKLDQVSSGTAPQPDSPSTSRIPTNLVGEWHTGSVSSVNYVSPSGSYAPPSGTQVTYKIFADGHYEYAALTQQSMYNCTTKLFLYNVGVFNVQGNVLTFTVKDGSFTSEDNCNARFNYKKPAKLEQKTYQWRVERDQYGEKLCLVNSDTNGCAYRQK